MTSTPPSAGSLPPEAGRLGRRAIDGFLSLSAGNAARAVLKIALLAILGRLLTPADFGLVEAAGIVVWFSLIFASLGVAAALIQRTPLEARHVATAATSSLVLGLVIAALMYAFAPAIEAALRVPRLTPMLRGLALVFPLAGLSAVAECLLQRRLRFGLIAGGELVSYALGYGVVGVTMAVLGFGAWALVGAEIAKTIVKSALYLRAEPDARRFGFDPRALRELLRFGSGYTASGIATYVATQGDNAVVARVLGGSALGFYGRAFELMLMPAQALGMVLDKLLFPTLALVQQQPDVLRLAYRRCTALVALLVLPLSTTVAALAPEIVAALLGAGWEPVAAPLRVLAAAMYFRVGYMVGHAVANSTGAVHQAARRNAIYAVLIVAGALVGSSWGLAGVAGGVLIAVVVNFVMVFRLAARITRLTAVEFLSIHAPAARIACVLGAEAWLVAALLRGTSAPPVTTLLAAGLIMGLTTLVALRVFPGTLGPEGRWIAEALYERTPRRLQPLLRRVMVRAS